jgi:hypothetical protein
MRRSLILWSAFAAASAAPGTAADGACSRYSECRGGTIGFIVGSVTNLGCVPRAAASEDRYVATIVK